MARAALSWSRPNLAEAAGIGSATVARFELGQTVAPESIEAMRKAMEGAGIMFLVADKRGGPGVRARASE